MRSKKTDKAPTKERPRYQGYDRTALFNAAFFSLFTALVVFNVLNHVPWSDELQALLIARESTGPISLFHNLAYEGHPGLWHAILMLALHIVSSPAALKLAQAPIAVSILLLLWFRSPFLIAEKFLLSAGYFLLLEYTVIARGYGLGVALFFAFVVWREKPIAWLLLGLMANISIHFGMLAGICGLLILHRGNRSMRGIALATSLALVAVIFAVPASDVFSSVHPRTLLARTLLALLRLSGAIVPFGWTHTDLVFDLFGNAQIRFLLSALVLVGGIISLRPRKDLQIAYLAACLSMFLIGALIFAGFDRHYGIVWIALIGFHWIAREDESLSPNKLFVTWSLVSAICAVFVGLPSLIGPFSGSDKVAAWVEQNAPNSTIAAFPAAAGPAISATTGKPTFNLQAARWNTFIKWNYPVYIRADANDVAQWIQRAPPGPLFLVSYGKFPMPLVAEISAGLAKHGASFELAAKFPGTAETYSIYKITGSVAPSGNTAGPR